MSIELEIYPILHNFESHILDIDYTGVKIGIYCKCFVRSQQANNSWATIRANHRNIFVNNCLGIPLYIYTCKTMMFSSYITFYGNLLKMNRVLFSIP